MKYDELTGEIVDGKKRYKPSGNRYLKSACKLAISMVARGESLADLPLNTDFPTLATIMGAIEDVPALATELAKAEESRLVIMKERLIKASEEYRKSPSPDQKDAFAAIHKTVESMQKQMESGTVVINYHSMFSEDFWKAEPKPENPREK